MRISPPQAKMHAPFGAEDAASMIACGLVAFGQIQPRKVHSNAHPGRESRNDVELVNRSADWVQATPVVCTRLG